MLSGQRELGLRGMIEGNAFPIVGDVTDVALVAIRAFMDIILAVATDATGFQLGVAFIHMASFTGDFNMFACEWECGFIMVEGDLFPVCCGVAEFALRSEPAIMFIILPMATDAGGVDLQTALGVACLTGQGAMFAIQKEVGLIM